MGAAGGEQRKGQGEGERGEAEHAVLLLCHRKCNCALFTNKDVKRLLGAWEFSYSVQGFDCTLSYG